MLIFDPLEQFSIIIINWQYFGFLTRHYFLTGQPFRWWTPEAFQFMPVKHRPRLSDLSYYHPYYPISARFNNWVFFYESPYLTLRQFLFTSFTATLFLNIALTIVSINLMKKPSVFSPNPVQQCLLALYWFIIDIINSSVYVKKNIFVLFYFFLFIFLVISNLMGMMPYSFTLTSHLVVTLLLSFTFFLAHLSIGIILNREEIFGLFLPAGVPALLTPLLIPIEYLSYFSRALSLAIRLFANMVSGHILLKILFGFFVKTLGSLDFYSKLLVNIVFYPTVSEPKIRTLYASWFNRCVYDPSHRDSGGYRDVLRDVTNFRNLKETYYDYSHATFFSVINRLTLFYEPLFILIWVWPLLILFAVVLLEFCIAVLQAYVFVVLLAIYLNDVINPH